MNAERMMQAMGLTPLLVELESMTAKPRAGGGSEIYGAWKIEKAMHCFVHTDEVSRGSSTD